MKSACQIVVLCGLLAYPSVVLAQTTNASAEPEETIRLLLSPAPEPKPALKYRFLVPPVDQIRANAATYVYKSMIFEAPDILREMNDAKLNAEIDAWLETPLAEMPRDEILGKVHWLVHADSEWRSL